MLRQLIIVFSCVLLTFSCQKPEDRRCLKGVGELVTVTREFPSLHYLDLYDFIEYRLIQDSTDKVVIHCGEHLVEHIITEWNDGELRITDENKCIWLRELPVDVRVDIHFTEIDSMRSESSGSIRTVGTWEQFDLKFDNWHTAAEVDLDVKLEECTLRLHAGSPIVNVHGQSRYNYLYNSGVGKLLTQDLPSEWMIAETRGAGEIRCNPGTGALWYLLNGSGNIYYNGEPSELLMISQEGSGELIGL